MSSARLLKNTGMMGIAKMLHPVISFFLFLTIIKFLGADGFGVYSTVFAYYTFFQIIASFGLKTLFAREVAKHPDDAGKYFLNGSLVIFPVSLINTGIMLILVHFLGYSEEVFLLSVLYGVAILGHAFNDMLEGFFTGLQKIGFIAAMFLFENVIRSLVTIFLLYQGYGLFMIGYVFIILKYITSLLYLYFIFKETGFSLPKFQSQFLLDLLKLARPFIGTLIFVTIFWRADIMILSKLRTLDEVGVYNAAYRFFWLFALLYKSFVLSFFPIISKSYHEDIDYYHRLCRKVIKIVILICIPIILMIFGFAEKLIPLLGEDFIPSVAVLKILGVAIFPYALSELFGHMLLASNRQKIDFYINGIKMIFNIGLHFLLISRWGVIGAAWAIAISYLFNILMQIPFILKYSLDVQFKMILEFTGRLIPALLCIGGFVYFIPLQDWIKYSLALVIFVNLVWWGNVISKQDKVVIRQVFEQKKRNGMRRDEAS